MFDMLASYHFKAEQLKNWRAFEFCKIIDEIILIDIPKIKQKNHY